MNVTPAAARPEAAGDAGAARRARELREAANAFESLFLQMLIDRMREAQLDSGFFGESAGASLYEGLMSSQLAERLAERSPLGLADMMVRRWSEDPDGEQSAREALARIQAARAERIYGEATISRDPRPKKAENGDSTGLPGAPGGVIHAQVPGAATDEND